MGAPRSTHETRLWKESSIYSEISNGNVIPDRVVQLGDFGETHLVTIGDSAFPQFAWLIKGYNENTRDNQKSISRSDCMAGELSLKAHMACEKSAGVHFSKKTRMSGFQPSLYCNGLHCFG